MTCGRPRSQLQPPGDNKQHGRRRRLCRCLWRATKSHYFFLPPTLAHQRMVPLGRALSLRVCVSVFTADTQSRMMDSGLTPRARRSWLKSSDKDRVICSLRHCRPLDAPTRHIFRKWAQSSEKDPRAVSGQRALRLSPTVSPMFPTRARPLSTHAMGRGCRPAPSTVFCSVWEVGEIQPCRLRILNKSKLQGTKRSVYADCWETLKG